MRRLRVMDWPPLPTIRIANEGYRLVVDTTDRRFSIPEDLLTQEARDICQFYLGLKTDSAMPLWKQWDEETLAGVEMALRRDIEDAWEIWLTRLTSNAGRKPRCHTEFVWSMRLRRRDSTSPAGGLGAGGGPNRP